VSVLALVRCFHFPLERIKAIPAQLYIFPLFTALSPVILPLSSTLDSSTFPLFRSDLFTAME
jgi:hypothetical protein